MSTVDISTGEAPEITEPDDELPPDTRRRPKAFARVATRVAIALLAVVVVAGCAVGGWSMIRHHTSVRDAARDAQLLDFSKDAVAQLVSTDSADPRGYVDRVLANSTGQWHDEFDARKRSVIDTMQASGGVTRGHGVAAGIERRNDDGSVSVLVVVTSQTSVPLPQPGPGQGGPAAPAPGSPTSPGPPSGVRVDTAPKQYQVRVDVTRVGGKFKLSKVGFVQ
ncbi:hypothetical protein B7C42_04557 [Nocardia cerradoensis]|uniref:Mce-associated membrane protein n=1 Tax=Nocardia cerradoensis TaxID=85688 RepID=A0A231H2Q8_9NOCA|nr:hypothetical protein [Nocardia cerradoensis]OXR43135.1 hypothetical protein B7C42_04557 [Nocardia cerradoensis]